MKILKTEIAVVYLGMYSRISNNNFYFVDTVGMVVDIIKFDVEDEDCYQLLRDNMIKPIKIDIYYLSMLEKVEIINSTHFKIRFNDRYVGDMELSLSSKGVTISTPEKYSYLSSPLAYINELQDFYRSVSNGDEISSKTLSHNEVVRKIENAKIPWSKEKILFKCTKEI